MKKLLKPILIIAFFYLLMLNVVPLFEFFKAEILYQFSAKQEVLIRSAAKPIGYSDELKPYDRLQSINGISFYKPNEATSYFLENQDQVMQFDVKRGSENLTFLIQPIEIDSIDNFGFKFTNDRHLYGLTFPQIESDFFIIKNIYLFLLLTEFIYITTTIWLLIRNNKIGFYFSVVFLLYQVAGYFFFVT